MEQKETCKNCIYWQNNKCCITGKDKKDGPCNCGFYQSNK